MRAKRMVFVGLLAVAFLLGGVSGLRGLETNQSWASQREMQLRKRSKRVGKLMQKWRKANDTSERRDVWDKAKREGGELCWGLWCAMEDDDKRYAWRDDLDQPRKDDFLENLSHRQRRKLADQLVPTMVASARVAPAQVAPGEGSINPVDSTETDELLTRPKQTRLQSLFMTNGKLSGKKVAVWGLGVAFLQLIAGGGAIAAPLVELFKNNGGNDDVLVPGVVTEEYSGLTDNSVVLNGKVDPRGSSGVTYQFEIRQQSNPNTRRYAPLEPENVSNGNGYSSVTPEPVDGLISGQNYEYRLIVDPGRDNANPGEWFPFTTYPMPYVSLVVPSGEAVAATSVQLTGTVDTEGQPGLTYFMQYMQQGGSQWLSTPSESVPSGSGPQPVGPVHISGLQPGVPYQAQLVVQTSNGTTQNQSQITQFTTHQYGALVQPSGQQGCVTHNTTIIKTDNCAAGTGIIAGVVTASPNGESIYSATGSTVGVFARGAGGVISQLSGTAGCISVTDPDCTTGRALSGANTLTFSPGGKNAYLAAYYDDSIVIFDRDPTTGALTQKPGTAGCINATGTSGCATGGRALVGAFTVVMSPDGKNVYVGSRGDDNDLGGVAVFTRDTTTGELSQLPGTAGCVNSASTNGCQSARALFYGATGVVIDPSGGYVYVAAIADSAIDVFQRDPTTGALTQLTGTAGCLSSDPNVITTYSCTSVLGISTPAQIVFSPDQDAEQLYVASEGYDSRLPPLSYGRIAILQRNKTTGTLSQLAGAAGCVNTNGAGGCTVANPLRYTQSIAISSDGKNAYVQSMAISSSDEAGITIFNRDPSNGGLTPLTDPQTKLPGPDGCVSENPATVQLYGCSLGRGLTIGPYWLVTSPDGNNLYAASYQALSIFTRAE